MTLMRTRGRRVLPLGVEHIKKRSRIKQNAVTFKGRGCVSLIRTKGDKGVASDSKRSKNGQEMSRRLLPLWGKVW